MKSQSIYLTLILTFLASFSNGEKVVRQLYGVLNPNCNISNCDITDKSRISSNNLIYIRADGDNDTIHYLWSTVGAVSMLIARTDLKTDLTVNWDKFFSDNSSNSVNFTSTPLHTSVVVFTKLYEYNDTNDKNNITKVSDDQINPITFTNMTWQMANIANTSCDEVSADLAISSEVGDIYGNQTIKFHFVAYGYDSHAKKLPRLLHTPHSFQLEFVIDHFDTRYNKTRFVLEAVVMSSESSGDFELQKFHSIDDEYTPGVFTTVQMTSPLSRSNDWGCYLQWKPVCYKKDSSRTTKDSTETQQALGDITIDDRLNDIQNSLAYAFYGSEMQNNLMGWINISYGLHGDNFYQDTNYSSCDKTI